MLDHEWQTLADESVPQFPYSVAKTFVGHHSLSVQYFGLPPKKNFAGRYGSPCAPATHRAFFVSTGKPPRSNSFQKSAVLVVLGDTSDE
jgi:hypothetical protein